MTDAHSNDPAGIRSGRGLPLLSVGLSVAALMVALVPGLPSLLQFDVAAVRAGEVWRILSGHLTHWNNDHLLWDVSVFVVLGVLCERRSRPAFLITLLLSAATISAHLLGDASDLATYRGLSGIDSALFCLWAVQGLADAADRGDRPWMGIIGIALCGLLGKLVWEFVSGTTLFVDHDSAGFVPLPMAHLLGAVCGVTVAATQWSFRQVQWLLRLSVCEATDRCGTHASFSLCAVRRRRTAQTGFVHRILTGFRRQRAPALGLDAGSDSTRIR